jgi:hypothetical protein
MARAGGGTPRRRARPATAGARTDIRRRRYRGRRVASANRRGRDGSRHAHGDVISRAVHARRKPVQLFALALFATSLLATSLRESSRRRFRLVLPAAVVAVPWAHLAFGPNHSTNRNHSRPVRSCGLLTFRYRRVDKVYWLIQQSEEPETACGVRDFVRWLAALSSVYFRTQPNSALLLTH